MKRVCFALTVPAEYVQFESLKGWQKINGEALQAAFPHDYEISYNFLTDKDSVDLVVIPEPEPAVRITEAQLKVPVLRLAHSLFLKKEFKTISAEVKAFFEEEA